MLYWNVSRMSSYAGKWKASRRRRRRRVRENQTWRRGESPGWEETIPLFTADTTPTVAVGIRADREVGEAATGAGRGIAVAAAAAVTVASAVVAATADSRSSFTSAVPINLSM
jgi:hypothetical protein